MNAAFCRRTVLAVAVASVTLVMPSHAQKSEYPVRPVKVVVPFVPGGNADSTARIFAEAYAKYLGQPFVVDNKGGAGGMIGAAQMIRSEADGYTVMIGTTAPIVASWQMAGRAAQYSMKDMRPIALLTQVPGVIVVNASSPVRSYPELLALVKSRPNPLIFGHPGNGTAGHVNILQMQKAISQSFIITAYKGAGPAVQELLSGQLDAVATDLPSALALIKGGKLRALGVVFAQRVPALPDVATMTELKQPEIDIAPFTAIMAPRQVPDPVIARLVDASVAALNDVSLRKRIEDIGGVPVRMSSPDFERFLARQVETYHHLVASGLLTAE